MRKQVVVLGTNFAGLTAALEVQHLLQGDVDVTVVAPTNRFLFTPSLIRLPFGVREREDITFPVEPTLERRGVGFVRAAATGISPEKREVALSDGTRLSYDYLVVATGHRSRADASSGVTENASIIASLPDAERTATAWRAYRDRPGDVVIAASQGAVFGAAYEFLFSTALQLRKAGLDCRVKLTFVTAEPFLGHFSKGGLPLGEQLLSRLLRKEGIEFHTSMAIDHVDEGAMVLADGQRLRFHFGVVVPSFLGQEFLSGADDLVNERGFLKVRATYQSEKYDDIYGVGAAVAVDAPWHTAIPVGVPRAGFPTERMGRVAAHNIAAQVRGDVPDDELDFNDIATASVMDAGNNGAVILADRELRPRRHGVLVPGPAAHLMKLGFEKYFLWKMRNGRVSLPMSRI